MKGCKFTYKLFHLFYFLKIFKVWEQWSEEAVKAIPNQPQPTATQTPTPISNTTTPKAPAVTEQSSDAAPTTTNTPNGPTLWEPPKPRVEKIITHREVEGKVQYFVKWKDKSYIHASWVGPEEFQNERYSKARLQRYQNKNELPYDEADELFNPAFVEVFNFFQIIFFFSTK